MNNFAVLCEILTIGGVPIGQMLGRIIVYQGDSFKVKCWARDLFGRAINLTSYTTTIEIDALNPTVTPITNIAGEFDFDVSAAQSTLITVGNHDLKFKFTHSNGAVTRVVIKSALEIKAA